MLGLLSCVSETEHCKRGLVPAPPQPQGWQGPSCVPPPQPSPSPIPSLSLEPLARLSGTCWVTGWQSR